MAALTAPDAPVFIGGSEPQILAYAERQSPTRFVIMYPLTIPTPMARGYQQEAIQALERCPPSVIVMVGWVSSWLPHERSPRELVDYLKNLIASHYERVGGWVIDESDQSAPSQARHIRQPTELGHWQEPLPDAQESRTWLVLYRRKGER